MSNTPPVLIQIKTIPTIFIRTCHLNNEMKNHCRSVGVLFVCSFNVCKCQRNFGCVTFLLSLLHGKIVKINSMTLNSLEVSRIVYLPCQINSQQVMLTTKNYLSTFNECIYKYFSVVDALTRSFCEKVLFQQEYESNDYQICAHYNIITALVSMRLCRCIMTVAL